MSLDIFFKGVNVFLTVLVCTFFLILLVMLANPVLTLALPVVLLTVR